MTVRNVGDKSYSYRSIRRGGRVLTEYLGTGPLAQLLSQQREAERARVRAERQADAERTRLVVEWSRWVDGVVRTALEAAGYHRHERGEWRKRKVATNEVQPTKPGAARPARSPEVQAIEQRWLQGDETITSDEAQAYLKARPEVVDSIGSPAGTLMLALMQRYVGRGEIERAATMRKFWQVVKELAGPDPTPMETLLAERAALCWLEVNFLQAAMEWGKSPDSVPVATYRQRRVDMAHRRFLSAVKTLAVVRKLAVPALLVNVDGRSVHFTTPAPATPEAVSGPTIHVPGE